jgi:hypothetical protein
MAPEQGLGLGHSPVQFRPKISGGNECLPVHRNGAIIL